jgi:hypothetical protein
MYSKAVIFIETRILSGLQDKVNSIMKFLPYDWDCIVVCSNRNEHLFSGVKYLIKDIDSLTQYNEFMTSKSFWDSLPYDYVLICQHDSGLLRHGIDQFLKWDYVGAPWPFCQYGGNGGLSIRNVKVFREILSKFKFNSQNGNEDVFYSTIMDQYNYKIAPREVCEEFSVESEFLMGTLGYHFGTDSDRYLTNDQKLKILNQYNGKVH